MQIAIDGTETSGKGEIAARLAKKLGLLYIYTGAMYRALALACIKRGVLTKNEADVLRVLDDIHIAIHSEEAPDSPVPYKLLLDGEDITGDISSREVALGASDVGVHKKVREHMVMRQQQIANGKQVVMEGRDIGFRVLPNATLKIYLTATLDERAKRRWKQLVASGTRVTLDEIRDDIRKRDEQDMKREIDPLVKLPDAWELDTTGKTPGEVVETIAQKVYNQNL